MLPDHGAFEVDDVAGRLRQTLRQEGAVVVARNEADLSAVRLIVHRQAHLARKASRVRLWVVAYREEKAVELLTAQRVEHVALVLAVVLGAQEVAAGLVAHHTRVVARGQVVGVEGKGAVEQRRGT